MTWPNHWPMLSRPHEGDVLRVLSHGGGVQTTALCLMAARGDIGPMPDVAIFADTGGEPRKVYAYLDWLQDQVPFPIRRVRRPGPTLAELTASVAAGERPRSGAALPPLYTSEPKGMLPKQCSREFKTRPVTAEVRRMLGLEPRQRVTGGVRVEMWIGISKDEIWRAARHECKWIHNRHPLVELNMTRADCIQWLQERQYRMPFKSSCVYCPFRTGPQWVDMQENDPEDFADAVAWDKAFRAGWPGMSGEAFIHRDMLPLDEVDFRRITDPDQHELFPGSDCDSCGV
jgi:hypothetical protein